MIYVKRKRKSIILRKTCDPNSHDMLRDRLRVLASNDLEKQINAVFLSARLCSLSLSFIYFLFFIFLHFRASPAVYESSQASDRIGAVAAGLHHSHSSTGSKPCLRPIPQPTTTPDPWPTDRDQGSAHILMDASRILPCCATMETPYI